MDARAIADDRRSAWLSDRIGPRWEWCGVRLRARNNRVGARIGARERSLAGLARRNPAKGLAAVALMAVALVGCSSRAVEVNAAAAGAEPPASGTSVPTVPTSHAQTPEGTAPPATPAPSPLPTSPTPSPLEGGDAQTKQIRVNLEQRGLTSEQAQCVVEDVPKHFDGPQLTYALGILAMTEPSDEQIADLVRRSGVDIENSFDLPDRVLSSIDRCRALGQTRPAGR